MQTTVKLFIFTAIYAWAIVVLAQRNTAWTGDLVYRIVHLLLFITAVITLISRPGEERKDRRQVIARGCFLFACLVYALTYLSAVVINDLPLFR